MNELFPGLIVGIGKNVAWIVLDGEDVPRVSAIKRSRGKRAMPVPGDRAEAQLLEDGTVIIQRLLPRGATLQRHAARGRPKVMAANVDTLVTVTSLADPPPRLLTLDQLLAYTELEGTAAMVVLTKPDRAAPSTRLELASLYQTLRYPTLVVNPKTRQNIDQLREALAGRHAMLAGVSGVGKSSIFRALGGDATVGAVSRAGLGKQTTSAARLYRLPSGFLIDSPGVNEFGLGRLPADRVAGAFREIRDEAPGCRFSDCTHRSEPGCAVRLAVARGHIAESRYESYRQILQMCYTAPRAEY
ncbi:MAG TPA: ribosome small subunit-dependent GTPase A [Candidatus Rubrimentiphilum sp.]|nr:ribosome small subunit-dependent GTPase A [Candidatus Rubrimentiphilum sp.]